ncbi:response regulator [Pedobacter sp. SD-b]|uniref:histidine kinase n=1 Tax=Pedobacter segetis TaxID=2793069 RepID=A0ABS1BGJ4_9SPHI|nr:hybrid sensor histidine kinase/response regulator [Pedobacter segetis]MBK0381957.1 response regulator [Pedobacter segetis]
MKTYKVLLVDDDEDDYILTKDIFNEIPQRENYKLSWINNYEEAINAMLKSHYDIYLVDYRLGKHTGIDLLNEAIKSNVDEPIIILTGKGDSKVDEDALETGAADYLVKDQIDPYTIERAIRYAVKHKSTLKALRDSEKKFRIIFERSKEPFLIVDSLGAIKDMNTAGLSFFGLSKDEMLAINSNNLFNNKQDGVRFSEIMDAKGAVNDFETELKSNNNSLRKVSISAFLQIDQHATEELYYLIVHDITDLKKLEKEYITAEKAALTERIAKSLANKITNPLSNINLSIEQLKQEIGTENQDFNTYLDIINSNFDRINLLITDFINSTQSIALNIQPKSLNILLDESIEHLENELKQNHTIVNKNYNQTDLFIDVDYDKMVNTFYQIMDNAIAANAKTIDIQILEDNGNAIISIKDNGEGIEAYYQEKVFEPFFSTKQKNLGLGLTNAQKNISNHKGNITFESQKQEGTTFKISLPLAKQAQLWE